MNIIEISKEDKANIEKLIKYSISIDELITKMCELEINNKKILANIKKC